MKKVGKGLPDKVGWYLLTDSINSNEYELVQILKMANVTNSILKFVTYQLVTNHKAYKPVTVSINLGGAGWNTINWTRIIKSQFDVLKFILESK